MNRPSKNDDGHDHPGWNQSPPSLSAETTTRSDLNGIANSRSHRDHALDLDEDLDDRIPSNRGDSIVDSILPTRLSPLRTGSEKEIHDSTYQASEMIVGRHLCNYANQQPSSKKLIGRAWAMLSKYAKFIGPGAMVSVAYIDPGNYATDVAAGASFRFKLLFMVLVSNIFAIFLQSLCIKLGSVTGMNLAQMIRANTPPWLNYTLYFFAEAAIIATDIAEVIGTAIALNLLFHLPLVAGCAVSIVDVLVILFFYRPSGSMRGLRAFELFVMALVFGVVVCFCLELSLIKDTKVGEVFAGYLPSSALVQSQGLYQCCGILGATVMPHSLYLGSGMVQPRLLQYDKRHNNVSQNVTTESSKTDMVSEYKPSLAAIKSCMSYSIAELAISLFTFALFINSAILITAGASLHNLTTKATATSGNLFSIHSLLSTQLAKAAGVVFALALLLSGTSAGIVCTIAGQMVSEGQLRLSIKPWLRRLVTRSISITPSIIIAGAVGAEGLSTALEASQVALSIILPFVTAPLIWFTCRPKYMAVRASHGSSNNEFITNANDLMDRNNSTDSTGTDTISQPDRQTEAQDDRLEMVQMRNHWITATFAIVIWTLIVVMNVAAVTLLGLGVGEQ